MASSSCGTDTPVCPTCCGSLKRTFYPASDHGVGTTSETLYDEPAVILICPKCRLEWSRFCDQQKKGCKKAGCELHPTELCLWEVCQKVGKNGNISPHWALLCRICRRDGDKTRKKAKSKNGAVRGRCPNCGAPSWQYRGTQRIFEETIKLAQCKKLRSKMDVWKFFECGSQKRKALDNHAVFVGSTKQNRTDEKSTAAPATRGDSSYQAGSTLNVGDRFSLSDDELDKALAAEAVADTNASTVFSLSDEEAVRADSDDVFSLSDEEFDRKSAQEAAAEADHPASPSASAPASAHSLANNNPVRGGQTVEKAIAIQLREALRCHHGPAMVRVLDTTHMTAQQINDITAIDMQTIQSRNRNQPRQNVQLSATRNKSLLPNHGDKKYGSGANDNRGNTGTASTASSEPERAAPRAGTPASQRSPGEVAEAATASEIEAPQPRAPSPDHLHNVNASAAAPEPQHTLIGAADVQHLCEDNGYEAAPVSESKTSVSAAPDSPQQSSRSANGVGSTELKLSLATARDVGINSSKSAGATSVSKKDEHFSDVPDDHHSEQKAEATASETKPPQLDGTPIYTAKHQTRHDHDGASPTLSKPNLAGKLDGQRHPDNDFNPTNNHANTGTCSKPTTASKRKPTAAPRSPTTKNQSNKHIHCETKVDTVPANLDVGTDPYPDTKGDLTKPLLSTENSSVQSSPEQKSKKCPSDIDEGSGRVSKSERNNVDDSWIAIAKGLVLIEGRPCSSTASLASTAASSCESKSDGCRSDRREKERRSRSCSEYFYSHGICLDPDTRLVLCMHHSVAKMDPKNSVLVVYTFDEDNFRRRRSFVARRLPKPKDLNTTGVHEDGVKEVHDLDLELLEITHNYDDSRPDFRGNEVSLEDLQQHLAALCMSENGVEVGNRVRLMGYLLINERFDVVPDLKESVVGAVRGSQIRSDFVELPQSMSGSPVVNELGEVVFVIMSRPPNRHLPTKILGTNLEVHVEIADGVTHYSRLLSHLKVQGFIDQVLAYNKVELTVAYLREKHKHVLKPWGEGLTRKSIARLSDGVLFTIIAIFVVAACVAALTVVVVTIIIKENQNSNNKPAFQPCLVKYNDALNSEHCTCHGEVCVRGQYCYGLNGDTPTCHPAAVLQCNVTAFDPVGIPCHCGSDPENSACSVGQFCYDQTCQSQPVTCVWREKSKCFGGRPPDCGDALQEFSCVNEATNTTLYCEERCEGDKWKACSQTAKYTELVLNTPPKINVRSPAFAIGPQDSNCKTAFECTVQPEKNYHICCSTKYGETKPVFKADADAYPIISMFIQETLSSHYLWYMALDPLGSCPWVFRIPCDLSAPHCDKKKKSLEWEYGQGSNCGAYDTTLQRLLFTNNAVFALIMKPNYALHLEDWTDGNANTFLDRVNNSRRNKNKVYKLDQDLCTNGADDCNFDFTAAAAPPSDNRVAFRFAIFGTKHTLFGKKRKMWTYDLLQSNDSIVWKNTSEPTFATKSFQDCATDGFDGFGCLCGIDYNRVVYMVRDRVGSRVQLKDFTSGHDTALEHSQHNKNEEYYVTRSECASIGRLTKSIGWRSSNRKNDTSVISLWQCVNS